MSLGVLIQRSEHYWQDHLDVVANEIAEVLIVPEVECSLRNLRSLVSIDFQLHVHK